MFMRTTVRNPSPHVVGWSSEPLVNKVGPFLVAGGFGGLALSFSKAVRCILIVFLSEAHARMGALSFIDSNGVPLIVGSWRRWRRSAGKFVI